MYVEKILQYNSNTTFILKNSLYSLSLCSSQYNVVLKAHQIGVTALSLSLFSLEMVSWYSGHVMHIPNVR